MLNKFIFQWFWFDVTTKAQQDMWFVNYLNMATTLLQFKIDLIDEKFKLKIGLNKVLKLSLRLELFQEYANMRYKAWINFELNFEIVYARVSSMSGCKQLK